MATNSETLIQNKIIKALNKIPGVRVFRNSVGVATDGKGGYIRFGLANGSSDLIGYQSVTITPDMVGHKFARFVSVEVKTATGRLTDNQKLWLEKVAAAGGKAFIARSLNEAISKLGL